MAAKSSEPVEIDLEVEMAPPPRRKKPAPVEEVQLEMPSDDGEPILDIVAPAPAGAALAGAGAGGGAAAITACPACRASLGPGAIICVNCGYNVKIGRKMVESMSRVVKVEHGEETDTQFMIREKIAPIILAVLGFMLYVAFTAATSNMYADEFAKEFGEETERVAVWPIAVGIGIATVVATFFLTLGCFIAAKLLDTNFGDLRTAVLKLAAIYLMANGVTTMIVYWLEGMGWFYIYTSVGVGIYWILLMWLFELDGFEVFITASIFMLLQLGALFLVIVMIASMGMTGVAGAMGGGGPTNPNAFGGTIPAPDYDAQVQEMLHGDSDFGDPGFMPPDDFTDPDAPIDPDAAPVDPAAQPADPATEPTPDGMAYGRPLLQWPFASQTPRVALA